VDGMGLFRCNLGWYTLRTKRVSALETSHPIVFQTKVRFLEPVNKKLQLIRLKTETRKTGEAWRCLSHVVQFAIAVIHISSITKSGG
jgi:hypothetical protein